ncbi:MAG TPA: uroporphyrinogen decarboxylase family protein [Bacteroidota bacterium]
MNGYQRISAALRGERPDAVPVMLHNFMMAAREAGATMRQFRTDPRVIARAFIQAVERYSYDGIIVDVDTVTLAGAAGVPVDFPEDEPARVKGPLLDTLERVPDLAPVDIRAYEGVQVWLESVRLLKAHFGDEIYLRGNCDQCPFSLASLVRGIDNWMMDLLDPASEELVRQLLEYCAGLTLQFIDLMAQTGAHMLSNGDSVAGPALVSPRLFRRFAFPFDRRIVESSHRHGLPYILHICGNTDLILDDMVATRADGLEIDYKTDTALAHERLKGHALFVGNIDPSGVLALGTPALVRQKTTALLEIFRDTPRFILNAGCAIPPTTPPENLHAMIRTAREACR